MTISESLHRFFSRFKEKNNRFKEMENEYRFEKRIKEKQLSSNERELNRFNEENRQERIKKALEHFRKRKQNEFWHGKKVYEQKNLFKGQKSMLKQPTTVLINNRRLY